MRRRKREIGEKFQWGELLFIGFKKREREKKMFKREGFDRSLEKEKEKREEAKQSQMKKRD